MYWSRDLWCSDREGCVDTERREEGGGEHHVVGGCGVRKRTQQEKQKNGIETYHSSHSVDPKILENLPRPHEMHAISCRLFDHVPGGQGTTFNPSQKLPAGQSVTVIGSLISGRNFFKSIVAHFVASARMYPVGQSIQSGMPVLGAWRPWLHVRHSQLPLPAAFPAGHRVQSL